MIVHAFYPLAETRVQRQSEALIDQGYEVDVICLRGRNEPAEERHNGVNVYRLPVTLKRSSITSQFLNYLHFFLLAWLQLARLHRRRRYTSTQVHNLPDFLVFCTIPLKLRGVPIILDLHDLMPEFFAARLGKPMTHWLVRAVAWQERLACRFADQVITVTELWKQTLVQRGVPAHKIWVVMNVADLRVFESKTGPVPQRNGEFHILYHGTQAYRYGIDLLLRAADRLRSEIPQLRLTIHGNGTYNDSLMQLADRLKLGKRVHFSTRFVSLDELSQMIRAADVGVVPYRRDVFTDGILPTKLMEYVAMGVPVIAARTPAIQAYFDETMIEYFTPEDVEGLAQSILKLYRDPERRTALASNANVFHQRYNWGKLRSEYVDLVSGLSERKNGSAGPRAPVKIEGERTNGSAV